MEGRLDNMQNIWFTSDSHHQHINMLLFRKGFASIEEHDEVLIERWNKVVKKNDRVYHLGDIVLGKPAEASVLLNRLNGQIYLIKGNHDKVAEHHLCRDRFVWIKDYFELKIGDQKLCLMHYPLLSWNGLFRGSYMLCGHRHRSTADEPDCRRLDCGVDGHEFTPWNFEEVDQLLRNKPYPVSGTNIDL